MASTSELQDVRAEIKELKEKEKDLEAQIKAADATTRPALLSRLADLEKQMTELQKQKTELEKQKTLLLQKSVGKLQWWIKRLMAVLPTAAALGISERLAFTNLPRGGQYFVALLCDTVLRLALKFIVTEVHERFTEWRRNSVAVA